MHQFSISLSPDLVKAVLKEVSATDGSQPGLSSASSVALEGAEPHQPNAKVKRTKTPPAYYGRKVGESQEGSGLGASEVSPPVEWGGHGKSPLWLVLAAVSANCIMCLHRPHGTLPLGCIYVRMQYSEGN